MTEKKRGYCALCKSRCAATHSIEGGPMVAAGPIPILAAGGTAPGTGVLRALRMCLKIRALDMRTSSCPSTRRGSEMRSESDLVRERLRSTFS
jgi:hypothetical protein